MDQTGITRRHQGGGVEHGNVRLGCRLANPFGQCESAFIPAKSVERCDHHHFAAVRLGDPLDGDQPPLQRPDEPVVPIVASRLILDVGQRPRDTLVGSLDIIIQRLTRFGLQTVFRIPDTEGSLLQRKIRNFGGIEFQRRLHFYLNPFPIPIGFAST